MNISYNMQIEYLKHSRNSTRLPNHYSPTTVLGESDSTTWTYPWWLNSTAKSVNLMISLGVGRLRVSNLKSYGTLERWGSLSIAFQSDRCAAGIRTNQVWLLLLLYFVHIWCILLFIVSTFNNIYCTSNLHSWGSDVVFILSACGVWPRVTVHPANIYLTWHLLSVMTSTNPTLGNV